MEQRGYRLFLNSFPKHTIYHTEYWKVIVLNLAAIRITYRVFQTHTHTNKTPDSQDNNYTLILFRNFSGDFNVQSYFRTSDEKFGKDHLNPKSRTIWLFFCMFKSLTNEGEVPLRMNCTTASHSKDYSRNSVWTFLQSHHSVIWIVCS